MTFRQLLMNLKAYGIEVELYAKDGVYYLRVQEWNIKGTADLNEHQDKFLVTGKNTTAVKHANELIDYLIYGD